MQKMLKLGIVEVSFLTDQLFYFFDHYEFLTLTALTLVLLWPPTASITSSMTPLTYNKQRENIQ